MEKKSYFNVGRRLTDEEWGELRDWTNSLASHGKKFVRHDRHSSKPNRTFRAYNRRAINGERWIYDDPVYGASNPRYQERPKVKPLGQSFYNVNRWLSEEEFTLLRAWLKENPDKRRKFGEENEEGLHFIHYTCKARNGEYWVSKEIYNRYLDGFRKRRAKDKLKRMEVRRVKVKPEKDPLKIEMEKFRKSFQQSFQSWVKTDNHLTKRLEEIFQTTSKNFIKYIEDKWEPWMNWDNYGGGMPMELKETWDLDHIIPLGTAKNMEELLTLYHYTNTQPLCSFENRRMKIDRLDYIPISKRN